MYQDMYERWLAADLDDPDLKPELESIRGDDAAIQDRFAVALKFGTAGLRGVIGAGTNRMNIYVVRQATQGLANYILKVGGEKRGVAIAYDSRHMSPEFADVSALCLMSGRLSHTNKAAAFVNKLFYFCGDHRIFPPASACMGGIPVAYIQDHINIL